MRLAWKQVKRNGGAAGVDGRSIEETAEFLRHNWPELQQRLLDGTYRPRPVLRVEIPKPGGGMRKLGIPTVTDRLVQQAISQILHPVFDPEFVESKLKLKVNRAKSAVGRPWKRTFLGFSFTNQRRPRIRIPKETLRQFRLNLKSLFRQGRRRNLFRFTQEDLNPTLRGWLNYFRLAETKGYAEELDGWLRRRLRCILWRQWKRGRTRYKQLRRRGLDEKRARASAYNGRGAWWNSGASHMNDTFRKRYFDNLGLLSLLDKLLSSRTITT